MTIPGLDGLRAIAFLLVFALHTDYLQIGWIGVQFFFVLSGFLITGILLDMKKALSPREYFFKFYGRRFLRIFPLYYFYLLLMSGVVLWLISISYRANYMQLFLDQVWYAVYYVYDFFFATVFFEHSLFLDHFWSLSVDEQFYIFCPLLILLFPEKWSQPLFHPKSERTIRRIVGVNPHHWVSFTISCNGEHRCHLRAWLSLADA